MRGRSTLLPTVLAAVLLLVAAAGAATAAPLEGTWRSAGNMWTPREGGGAGNGVQGVALADGRVLMAGGFNTESSGGVFTYALQTNYLNSAEVYNPATGIWARTGSMNQSRFAPAMALLPNGKVLAAGGYGGGFGQGVFRNSAEVWDPATGIWTPTASMYDCRVQPSTTVLPGGRVLVIGGNGCTAATQATAELYDPATGAWTRAANMSTPRASHTATLLPDGRVLVAGGRQTDGAIDRVWATAEIYNPSTDSWTSAGSMRAPHTFHGAGLLSTGKVIVAGGYCQNQTPVGPSPSLVMGCATDTAELYDPATNSWLALPSMTTKRLFAGSAVLPAGATRPGMFLMAGGGQQQTAELYDPVSNSWILTGSMRQIHDDAPLIPLPGGDILIAGGFKATGPNDYRATAAAEIYHPHAL